VAALALERDAKVQASSTHMLDPGARAVARLPANPFLGLTPPSVTPLANSSDFFYFATGSEILTRGALLVGSTHTINAPGRSAISGA